MSLRFYLFTDYDLSIIFNMEKFHVANFTIQKDLMGVWARRSPASQTAETQQFLRMMTGFLRSVWMILTTPCMNIFTLH